MNDENYTVTITINPNDFLNALRQTLTEFFNDVYFGKSTTNPLTELPESMDAED